VTGLVGSNLLEATTDPRGEASFGEGFGVVLGECLAVECLLEMLESERILQDLGVCKTDTMSIVELAVMEQSLTGDLGSTNGQILSRSGGSGGETSEGEGGGGEGEHLDPSSGVVGERRA
jgi:hypothetical protein